MAVQLIFSDDFSFGKRLAIKFSRFGSFAIVPEAGNDFFPWANWILIAKVGGQENICKEDVEAEFVPVAKKTIPQSTP
ncbi:MAG: hypothetical protein Kow0027_14360 [Saprospiraceae bacterium]